MTNDELRIAYELYSKKIYNICYNCLSHVENSEDIVISVFIEACNKRDSISLDKIESFLVVVAKSKIIDLQRRKKIWHRIEKKIPKEDVFCYIPDRIDTKNRFHSVLSAINKLPPKMKLVLELMYIEGYNRNEVAKITETSPNTVRNTIVTALSKLKQLVPCDE